MNRRDFLSGITIGGILGGLNLNAEELGNKDKSVIWIWLSGGAAGPETFNHPTSMNIPSEYLGINGYSYDSKTGIVVGSDFESILGVSDKISVVRSLSHGDAAHTQGTFEQLNSFKSSDRSASPQTKYPSHGAITSYIYGTNHPITQLPTFVALDKVSGDEPSWLGSKYSPFQNSNKDNLIPKDLELRYQQRLAMVSSINNVGNRNSELEKGIVEYQKQAYSLIFGKTKEVFDIKNENPKLIEQYGKGFGEKLLLARRLAMNGTRWVSISDGGWDMHSDIETGMKKKVYIAQAIKTLIEDIYNQGLNEKILVVVTTEFNRTKLVTNSGSSTLGRNHHPYNIPLLFSGGKYSHGRTIGETDKYGYIPEGLPFSPKDLQRTLFQHLEIDLHSTATSTSGRPMYLHDTQGKESRNILES